MRGTMQFSIYEYTILKKTQTQSEYIMYAKANKRLHFPFTFYELSAQQMKVHNHEIKATYTFRKENTKLKQCTYKSFM